MSRTSPVTRRLTIKSEGNILDYTLELDPSSNEPICHQLSFCGVDCTINKPVDTRNLAKSLFAKVLTLFNSEEIGESVFSGLYLLLIQHRETQTQLELAYTMAYAQMPLIDQGFSDQIMLILCPSGQTLDSLAPSSQQMLISFLTVLYRRMSLVVKIQALTRTSIPTTTLQAAMGLEPEISDAASDTSTRSSTATPIRDAMSAPTMAPTTPTRSWWRGIPARFTLRRFKSATAGDTETVGTTPLLDLMTIPPPRTPTTNSLNAGSQ